MNNKNVVNKKLNRRPVLTGAAAFFLGLGVLLTALSRWVFATWTGLKMDEIIYHLGAPVEGTGGGIIRSGILSSVLPAAVALVLFGILLRLAGGNGKQRRRILRAGLCLGLSLILFSGIYVGTTLDVYGYIRNEMEDSSFIEDHYADPAGVSVTFPEKKRNLIYIYLESVETTFADQEDGGAFSENVIPELTDLALENEDFSGSSDQLNGGHVLPGTTYTMAAIFGQSTGLPLKVGLSDAFTDERGSFNKMNTQDSFFSGVTALGDILKDQGYRQIFQLGSKAVFGGRELFFTRHGDFDILDYTRAVQDGLIPEDYYVFWGYEDEKLFANARQTLTEAAASGEPFNYTLLTVDTHFEDGYTCRLCRKDFPVGYANVMACSSRQVAAFVDWIRDQDFYENTTIVLAGDHLTMDRDFCSGLDDSYDRRTYTCYINAAATLADPDRTRVYSTLDAFPTTLAALGCRIEGDRLGLGTNLFSDRDTLLEEYGYEALSGELEKRSSFMEDLADIDIYSDSFQHAMGLSPSCRITVTDIDEKAGTMEVSVTQIQNIYESIAGAELEMTDFDDPDRVTMVPLEAGPDGSFTGTVSTGDLNIRCCRLSALIRGRAGTSYRAGELTGDLTLKTDNIYRYLGLLANCPDYVIFAVIRDDGTRMLDDHLLEGLRRLGLKRNISGHYRWSYYGIISPEGVTEDLSQEEIGTTGTLPDGRSYSVISQGGLSGAGGGAGRYLTCSVRIDGTEYAVQRIGLNFVVYDPAHSRVVDSVEFNTYDGLDAHRIDLSDEARGVSKEEKETEEERP